MYIQFLEIEKKIETTLLLGLYIGVYIYMYILRLLGMEKKMETAMVGLYRVCVHIYIYIGATGNGKEHGNHYIWVIQGLWQGSALDLTATGGAQIN